MDKCAEIISGPEAHQNKEAGANHEYGHAENGTEEHVGGGQSRIKKYSVSIAKL